MSVRKLVQTVFCVGIVVLEEDNVGGWVLSENSARGCGEVAVGANPAERRRNGVAVGCGKVAVDIAVVESLCRAVVERLRLPSDWGVTESIWSVRV